MDFAYSEKVQKLQARVSAFMEQHVYPNEETFSARGRTRATAGSPRASSRS